MCHSLHEEVKELPLTLVAEVTFSSIPIEHYLAILFNTCVNEDPLQGVLNLELGLPRGLVLSN